MKLKQELIDFIKSEDKELFFDDERFPRIITKEPLYGGYTLLLQESSSNLKNKLLSKTIAPLAIVDKNNEILYMPNSYKYNFANDVKNIAACSDNPEELKKEVDILYAQIMMLTKDIENEVFRILKEKLPLLDKQILSSINLDNYREKAIEKYKKKEEVEFPLSMNSISITQDLFVYYLADRSKLEANILDGISDYHFSNYEKYVAERECIRQYVEYIETNPDFKRQSDICSIIDGDKQSYAINYHDLKGNSKKYSFKKNVSRMTALNRTVLDYQVLDGIPIELIDTITWRSNILYDAKEYSKTKITEEETAIKLLLMGKVDEVASSHLDNEDIMIKVLTVNTTLLPKASNRLQNDINFIFNVMNNLEQNRSNFIQSCCSYNAASTALYSASKQNVYSLLPDTLRKSKEFLVRYMNLLNPEEYNCHFSHYGTISGRPYSKTLEEDLSLYTSSYEFSKLILEKVGCNAYVINMIPNEFFERNEILKILKEKKELTKSNCTAYTKIDKIKNLEYIYTQDEIQKNICSLSNVILHNREFILKNITSSALQSDTIFNIYEHDAEVVDKLIANATTRFYCDKFINYAKIDKTDSIKMFELCSKNIAFLELLQDNDAKLFIDGELSEIENISVVEDLIKIRTPNCTLELSKNKNITILSNDDPDKKATMYRFNTAGKYLEEKVLEILQENFKLRSRLYESVVTEIIYENKDRICEER